MHLLRFPIDSSSWSSLYVYPLNLACHYFPNTLRRLGDLGNQFQRSATLGRAVGVEEAGYALQASFMVLVGSQTGVSDLLGAGDGTWDGRWCVAICENGMKSVIIALCHAHVGLYNNDTCLVWELLLLPSDASAATSLPSLMAPDGNTSDHSRDYVSLEHVLYGCMVWNCPMMSRSYWPLVISVCSWNNPQWNMNPKLEGVRSNEHHLYLSPSSKSIFALLSVDACLPPRTYAVILLTPTRTDIAPECKPFLLLRAS